MTDAMQTARRRAAIAAIQRDCREVMGYEPCFAWLNSLSLSALQNEALCLSRAVEALREREREEEAAEAASKLLKEEEARQQWEDEKWEAFYKVLGIS